MTIIAKKSKREYSTAPEGLWPAVCCDVVDLGLVKDQWGERFRVEIRWILDENDPGLDPKTNQPYLICQKYTNSLHEKSRLRPMLEAWRGRKFTPEEEDGFDLEKLLGANCQLQIVHNIADEGAVYANVQAVVPAARNMVKMRVPESYVRVAEREKRKQLQEQGDEYHASDNDVPF